MVQGTVLSFNKLKISINKNWKRCECTILCDLDVTLIQTVLHCRGQRCCGLYNGKHNRSN